MKHNHARRILAYQDFKRALPPLTAVLEHYGLLASMKRVGSQLFSSCPIHNGSNKRQFVVNPETNEWKCFSPRHDTGGSTLEFVMAMQNCDLPEARACIARWFAIPSGTSSSQHRATESEDVWREAFVIRCIVVEGEGDNAFWHRCGSAWPHKDGKGLNMQVPTGMSLSVAASSCASTREDDGSTTTKAKKSKRVAAHKPAPHEQSCGAFLYHAPRLHACSRNAQCPAGGTMPTIAIQHELALAPAFTCCLSETLRHVETTAGLMGTTGALATILAGAPLSNHRSAADGRDNPRWHRRGYPRPSHPRELDLEIAYNRTGDNLVLRVNKGPVQVFRVMLVDAFKHIDDTKLFNFNSVSPDLVFKIDDVREGLMAMGRSVGLTPEQMEKLEAKAREIAP